MDYLGTVLSVAQTLFAALQNKELKEMCSSLKYKSQLQEFEKIVKSVNAVLEDAADTQQQLNKQDQLFIQDLKDAVYDADDLFDEWQTHVAREHNKIQDSGENLPAKLSRIFFRLRKLGIGRRMSQNVTEIEGRLAGISQRYKSFEFTHGVQRIPKSRETSYSVYEPSVIGREDDKNYIMGMLLKSNVQQGVSFLTIIGMGGLGKTTLAQLVYNHENIKKEFPIRVWTCIGDENPENLNVKQVLAKIWASETGEKRDESTLDLGWLKTQVQNMLKGKFLLVLDDIWNENRCDWLDLAEFFKILQPGSWVVVTTRSWKAARVISDREHQYPLKGLSDEHSWNLFKKFAFAEREHEETSVNDRIEVGRKIVKKCVNVPLAIKVMGTLLYGEDKNGWEMFEKIKLAEVGQVQNNILPILKLSYHNLTSQLKSCFTYCALFPKDTVLYKEDLIRLWMAQGYVMPSHENESLEHAGEEYFKILLGRCFLQPVNEVDFVPCKMHDLMHEMAHEVAEKDMYVAVDDDVILSDLDEKKVRHLYVERGHVMKAPLKGTKVRTALVHVVQNIQVVINPTLEKWTCIRALQLCSCGIEKLPESIGKLLHLRYLDLSLNDRMEVLPKSFTKLHNLQTLILNNCLRLKELPSDFSKLCKLRVLDTFWCFRLTHMPLGMGKLSFLCKLSRYAVDMSKLRYVEQLEGLKALTKLEGSLKIAIRNPNNIPYVKREGSEGGFLSNKQDLKEVRFRFGYEFAFDDDPKDYHEELMEDMQVDGNNMMSLGFDGYGGGRMPSWIREDKLTTCFSKLEIIEFRKCSQIKCLPTLSKLRQLRRLTVRELYKLEYMEERSSMSSEGEHEYPVFFPSLVELYLWELPKLKGWWRGSSDNNNNRVSFMSSNSFPLPSELHIVRCPELTGVLPGSSNKDISEGVRVTGLGRDERGEPSCSHPSSSSSTSNKLRMIEISNTRNLTAVIPMEALQHLQSLTIVGDNIESLEEVEKVFQTCSSSLRSLELEKCKKLKSVHRGGFEYLTALETLEIRRDNPWVSEEEEGVEDYNPWLPLQNTLRSLTLLDVPQLVELPAGIRHLTSLQSLRICGCRALKSLPEWMQDLTALTQLEVWWCSEEVALRCRGPSGSDWPYIQHIPRIKSVHDNLPHWEWHR